MNNSKEPYRIDDIDFNNIKYVEKITSEKTIIYTKYEHKNKLTNFVIQTPSLRNINNITSNKSGIQELDIPLVGQNNLKTERFIGFLNNLDQQIINDAKKNSNGLIIFIMEKL